MKSLVIIDTQLAEYERLLAGLSADQEVLLLDPTQDGLLQIAHYLDGLSGYDAIHMLSHGSEAQLYLGNTTLTSSTLDTYADALKTLGQALTDTGDLLFYGCNVAQGEDGQRFVQQIAEITGADVAASEDLTGSAASGGDWMLEAATGNIEVAALTYDAMQTFDQTLAAPVFSNLDGAVTYQKGTDAVRLDSDVSVTDADGYAGSTFTFSRSGGANTIDNISLRFLNPNWGYDYSMGYPSYTIQSGYEAGSSSLNYYDVWGNPDYGEYDVYQFGDYSIINGQLTVHFTGIEKTVTQADVNEVLRAISYSTSSASLGAHDFTWQYDDGTGGVATGTSSVTVKEQNYSPTGSVTISGSAYVGNTLTASDNLADTNGMGEVSYTWYRVSQEYVEWNPGLWDWRYTYTNVGSGNSYLVQGSDVGFPLVVVASYTDIAGYPEEAFSSQTSAVSSAPAAPPPPPASPDLFVFSDTGTSSSDNVTSVKTPVLSVGLGSSGAVVGDIVKLFDGTSLIISYTLLQADINAGKADLTSNTLADGNHQFAASLFRASDGLESEHSLALTVTIDTAKPVLASATVNGANLTLTYAEISSGLASATPSAGDFSLTTGAGNTLVTIDSVALDTTTKTLTLTLHDPITYANQNILLDYVGGTLQDIAGNAVDAFTDQVVTNQALPPIAAPSIDLLADSDSGVSNSDNITHSNSPSLRITLGSGGQQAAVAGDVIRLHDGAVQLGSDHTLTSDEVTNGFVDLANALSEGSHTITAKVISGGLESPDSSLLAITIDTAAPVWDTESMTVSGNQLVMPFSSNDLAIGVVPAADRFSVTQNGSSQVTVTGVILQADKITLTLSEPLPKADSVTVSYAVPTSEALQDVAGNLAPAISNISVTNLGSPPPTAPTIDLIAASDTGSSATDNQTSDTTPTFQITLPGTGLVAGDLVRLYDGGTAKVAETILTAEDITNGSVSLTSSSREDGAHDFSATVMHKDVIDGERESDRSSLNAIIDTAANSLAKAEVAGNTLTLTFNTEADLDAGTFDFQEFALSKGASNTPVAITSGNVSGKQATLILGETLTYADYGLKLDYTAISVSLQDLAGNGMANFLDSPVNNASAPPNTTVSGTLYLIGRRQVGVTLTINDTTSDADGQGAKSHAWESSADGSTWLAIPGATQHTYTLTSNELGKQIRVVMRYVDGHGYAESLASSATNPIAEQPENLPGVITLPVFEGKVQAGALYGINASGASFPVLPTVVDDNNLDPSSGTLDPAWMFIPTYQWQFSNTPSDANAWQEIGGATSKNYRIADVYAGASLRLAVSYTDRDGHTETHYSAATPAVATRPADAETIGFVAVSGTLRAGEELSAQPHLADGNGLPTAPNYQYLWQGSYDNVNWGDLQRSVSNRYTLTDDNVGQYVRVEVSCTDNDGYPARLTTSAGDGTVSLRPENHQASGTVSISGDASIDGRLSAGVASITDQDGVPDDAEIIRHWQVSDDGGLSWTTAAWGRGPYFDSYDIDRNDAFKDFRLQLEYTDGRGYKETIPSNTLPYSGDPVVITIPGQASKGFGLFASASPDQLGNVRGYQWQRNGDSDNWVDIAGANANAYTLSDGDVGHAIRVQVTLQDYTVLTSAPSPEIIDYVGSPDDNFIIIPDGSIGQADGREGNDTIEAQGAESDLSKVRISNFEILQFASGPGQEITIAADSSFTEFKSGDTTNNQTQVLKFKIVKEGTDSESEEDSPIGLELNDARFENIDEIYLTEKDDILNILKDLNTGNGIEFNAGSGNDSIRGGLNDDTLLGGEGDDYLESDTGNDSVDGGIGNDEIIGGFGRGNDTLVGGTGVDTVKYTSSQTAISVKLEDGTAAGSATGTEIGTDSIATVENFYGGQGGDYLQGNAEANYINGYTGNDILDGGSGRDTLVGGDGIDTFRLSFSTNTTVARIEDLAPGEFIQVTGATFTGIGSGTGSAVLQNQVEVVSSGGTTTLHVGVDATSGFDLSLSLAGTYSAADFAVQGDLIQLKNASNSPADAVASSAILSDSQTTYVFRAGDFKFSDAETDNLHSVTVTTLPAQGKLQFTDSVDGQTKVIDTEAGMNFTVAEIAAGKLILDSAGINTGSNTSFTFRVGDAASLSLNTAEFKVQRQAANSSPIITSGTSASTAEDTPLTGQQLTANDAENDALRWTILQNASQGTLDLANNGAWSYTPAQNYNGSDTFEVQADDDKGGKDSQLISITVTAVNDAPTGTVTITGTATQGQTLTAANTLADADGMGTVSYQWKANDVAITNATNSTYTLTEAEVGKTIAVTASYTDGHGTAESKTSSATATVANVNDAPTGTVSITGTATQGQTLTAANTLADADGMGTVSYQWKAGVSDISGATSSTYTLTEAEVGKTIAVTASYTDGHGTAESKTSSATASVANVNDAPAGTVTITGITTEGQTLTAGTSAIGDPDGMGTFVYQWNRSGSPISGATNSSYALTASDVGSVITVTVSYTDGHGTQESLTSTGTTAINAISNALPSGLPSITGTATEDQTLTANTSSITDANGLGTFAYQWNRAGSPISGATNTSYTLGDNDVGNTISLTVSYTDGQGFVESLTSSATATVANVNDAPTGTVTITGTATQGQTLTASNTLADADGMGTVSYQWKAGGSNISGATSSTYTLTEAEVGKTITVTASYTDGHGTAEAVTSSATSAVTGSTTTTFTGSVADGYIAGAEIFIDANRNGLADTGESTGVFTDAQGNFTLTGQPTDPLIAVGGTNIDTKLTNTLLLKAPVGSTVINPLTTLLQEYIEAQSATSSSVDVATAESDIQTALGISAEIDLTTYDPLAQESTDTTAVEVQKLAAQIGTVATLSPSPETVIQALADTLATQIENNPEATLDLTDATQVTTLLEASGVTVDEATVTQIVTTTQAIEAATSFETIATSQDDGITNGNVAPTLVTPNGASFTNAPGNDTFSDFSGTLSASDVDTDATKLVFGIRGGTVSDGLASKTGSYGTLTVNTSNGAYTFTPNDSAIEGLTANTLETYTVTVSDELSSTAATFNVSLFNTSIAPTSRYTVLGTGPNLIDFVSTDSYSMDGQSVVYKGNSGIDEVYVGPAEGFVFDFTQAGLGNDTLYLSGNWDDYSLRSYSGSTISLGRLDEVGSETIKAISGDTISFGDGSLTVAEILGYLKGNTSEPTPHDASTPAWNNLATPTDADNTIRAVVLDPTGETLALPRPGVDLIVKGGSGVDTVYVTPGATVDATQLGLGQDVIHLQGDSSEYNGTASGSIVTLTHKTIDGESLKFLGGSATAFDQILFSDGAAKSVDVLNTLKASLTLDPSILDTNLTSTPISLL